ncbi:hypothetical protein PspLS_06580 [Pyricularia sp. CBS 133598]|nr:hypothetical protein PspLS_06580 [Pyricularia sp. CBS 133598]
MLAMSPAPPGPPRPCISFIMSCKKFSVTPPPVTAGLYSPSFQPLGTAGLGHGFPASGICNPGTVTDLRARQFSVAGFSRRCLATRRYRWCLFLTCWLPDPLTLTLTRPGLAQSRGCVLVGSNSACSCRLPQAWAISRASGFRTASDRFTRRPSARVRVASKYTG